MTYLSQNFRATRARTRRRSVLRLIQSRLSLWRSRNRLSQLTDDELRDIGVSRAAAARESRRGLWDVPSNWRD